MSNYRYPGARPFTEGDQAVFFGRKKDISSLSRVIKLEELVVLYGKSGLGKTSLINAGVIPKIQKEDQLHPLYVRFGRDNQKENLVEILSKNIKTLYSGETFLKEWLPKPSLWTLCKEYQILTKGEQPLILFFDQFEEVFSYSKEARLTFKQQLSELFDDQQPADIQDHLDELMSEQPQVLSQPDYQWLFKPLNVKVLIAIRSDKLSMVDNFKDYFPNILRHTYELESLNKKAAREAIIMPALMEGDFETPIFSYTETSLEKILGYLADNHQERIESFQLQIICQYIEKHVVSENNVSIDPDEIGDLAALLKNYYDNEINSIGTPEEQRAARILIEEGLIFKNDRQRVSKYRGEIIENYGISEALLEKLVASRLLRIETSSTGAETYEVSHDTLVEPILASREKREEVEKKDLEAELIKQKEENERLRQLMEERQELLAKLTQTIKTLQEGNQAENQKAR